MLHSELIEWSVVQFKDGKILRHNEGAQSVFGLTRARQVQKKLGPAWRVRKAADLFESPPDEKEKADASPRST